jgi:hypothetical protein
MIMRTTLISLLMASLLVTSCDDKNDDTGNDTAAKITEVSNRAVNGRQWRVTNYTEDGLDQTSAFVSYIFEFDTNNLLTVTNGSDNFSGNWTVTIDGSDDNKSEFGDVDFNIAFTNPPMFAELTEDWEIASISDTKIELKHTSGGNGMVDLLTFEKV